MKDLSVLILDFHLKKMVYYKKEDSKDYVENKSTWFRVLKESIPRVSWRMRIQASFEI